MTERNMFKLLQGLTLALSIACAAAIVILWNRAQNQIVANRNEARQIRKVQEHQNDGLRRAICFLESRELQPPYKAKVTGSERASIIQLWDSVLAAAKLPPCRTP